MCDMNSTEVFDQINHIAEHLLAEVSEDLPTEKKKRLRHGLNLIISLSGFQDNLVTPEDLALLGMGNHEGHHSHHHSHKH